MMNAFSRLHPIVALVYLASVIVLGIVVRNPVFAITGLALASVSYLSVCGAGQWRFVIGAAAFVPIMALFNGLFNSMGQTVLFVYLGGRHFTLESLALGAVMGVAFSTALLWFGCFDRIMTSDRLTYLFGGAAPALTLTLTMALRLVPRYRGKAAEIAEARRAVGEGATGRGLMRDASSAARIMSALTNWAFEGAIATADSMSSRGYGCARRTSYARYSWSMRDIVVLVLALALDVVVIVTLASGAESTTYLPSIVLPEGGLLFAGGLICYGALCMLPLIVNGYEELRWRRSISTI